MRAFFKFKLSACWAALCGLLAVVFLTPMTSAAEQHCQQQPHECVAIGQWQVSLGVGLGGRSNPLVGGSDIPILLLPQASYYGERFFFDTTTLGFSLHEGRHQSLALVTTLGFDQMYFSDLSVGNFALDRSGGNFALSSAAQNQAINGDKKPPQDNTFTPNTVDQNGPNEFFHGRPSATEKSPELVTLDGLSPRRLALLGGIEYGAYYQSTGVSVQLLSDLIGVHRGQEIRAGLDQRLYQGHNRFTVAGGVVWQNDDLVDYYYGLKAGELGQNPDLTYQAGDSVTPYVRLDWQRPLAKSWTLQASLQQKWFGRAIKESPLVERDGSTTVFVGGVYHF